VLRVGLQNDGDLARALEALETAARLTREPRGTSADPLALLANLTLGRIDQASARARASEIQDAILMRLQGTASEECSDSELPPLWLGRAIGLSSDALEQLTAALGRRAQRLARSAPPLLTSAGLLNHHA
jgi:hypothetical protein